MPRLSLLSLLLPLSLSACAVPALSPLRVTVTDATTSAPVDGAQVIAETPSQDHPFSIQTIFGQTGPIRSEATTDSRGIAEVEFVPGRPVRIGVLAPSYSVIMQLCEEPWRGPLDLTADAVFPSERLLNVHVEPTDATGEPQQEPE